MLALQFVCLHSHIHWYMRSWLTMFSPQHLLISSGLQRSTVRCLTTSFLTCSSKYTRLGFWLWRWFVLRCAFVATYSLAVRPRLAVFLRSSRLIVDGEKPICSAMAFCFKNCTYQLNSAMLCILTCCLCARTGQAFCFDILTHCKCARTEIWDLRIEI